MEFILEQQAQFTVDMQQLREAQTQTDQVVNRLAAATLEGFKDVNAKIDALVDSQMRLQDSHARLAESQAQTDESLKNLIAVVDRYLSKGNNSKTEDKN
jgi:predicted transcriptional regulator